MKSQTAQMRRTIIVLLTVINFLISLTPHAPAKPIVAPKVEPTNTPVAATDAAKKTAREAYGNLPLSFEPNLGQADKRVKFLTRGSGYALFLTATGALLVLNGPDETAQGLRMKLVGGNSTSQLTGERRLEGESNYLIGSNQRKWTKDIPTFAKVRGANVYPGIDVVYYGSDQRRLEYDFVVKPGADAKRIRLAFEGADKVSLDEDGGLRLATKGGDVVQPAPVIYQEADGQRQTVAGRYVLAGGNEVVFEVAEYDHSRTLVIDPKVIYASFHGGSSDDRGEGIAVDTSGSAYVVGSTPSTNLPLQSPLQGTLKGNFDFFILKINAAGEKSYSTYLGGSNNDFGSAIAVMSDGKICVTGNTVNSGNNSDYPVTSGRFQGNGTFLGDRGVDAVMTVLNAAGNGLFYSTFIGGHDSESGEGIAVDGSNRVYVSGTSLSHDFPTKNAFQEASNSTSAFIAKFDTSQSGNSSLVYSSCLGGSHGLEYASAIAVTASGVAFFTGTTGADDFPTRSPSSLPSFQTTYGGGEDGFIAKVSPSGSLIYSTYFGGNGDDFPTAIDVDANERAYVTGFTTSSAATFPLKNAFDSTRSGAADAFVAKFNADGTTLFYSSFISGSNASTQGGGIAVDTDGSAFVTGFSAGSIPFPVVGGFPPNVPNGNLFLVKVGPSDATGTTVPAILFSDTLAGGVPAGLALDGKGNVYIAGTVSSGVINPTITPGAFQQTHGGGSNDAWVIKINFPPPDTIGVFRPSQFLLRNSNTSGRAEITLGFGQPGDQPIAGDWNGDGIDDVGVFRDTTHQFLLRQPVTVIVAGVPIKIVTTITITFGVQGDLAVVGDWNGDGIDTPGVFRPSTGQWFLNNGPNINNSAPQPQEVFSFGQAGDTPLAGDWDGDGIDTVGLFRGSIATFILSNSFNGTIDIPPFLFGSLGSVPVTGDWDGDGVDTIGIFQSNLGSMNLNNTNTSGNGFGDLVFNFGQSGDVPLAGDWDGKP